MWAGIQKSKMNIKFFFFAIIAIFANVVAEAVMTITNEVLRKANQTSFMYRNNICIKRKCNSNVSHCRPVSSLPLTNDRPDHKCSGVTEMLMMNIVMLMTEVLMILVD